MAPFRRNAATRWTAIILLVVCGLALILSGLLVPAHFRALDADVVQEISLRSENLVEAGIRNLTEGQMGQARLFLDAARVTGVGGAGELDRVVRQAKEWRDQQGAVSELEMILGRHAWATKWDGQPALQLLTTAAARQTAKEHLSKEVRSGVLELLRTLELKDLAYFSPAGSASGQPYEAVCLMAALLVQEEQLSDGFRDEIEGLAYAAMRKGQARGLEQFYLDLVSLAHRLNWSQLVAVLGSLEEVRTLHDLANLIRHYGEKWPMLAAAVLWEEDAAAVTDYLLMHAKTGQEDLMLGLRSGRAGLARVLESDRRLYDPSWRRGLVAYDPFYSVYATWLQVAGLSHTWGMLLKYSLIILGAFFLGRAAVDLMPMAEGIAVKRWASPAHWALFGALVILFWALFEPFLFQQTQNLNFPVTWRLPMSGEALRQNLSKELKSMDMLSIVALVAFLVIQAIIYVICLVKLAEIRRQPVSSEVKLRLLENEENMFDAGLYCGLGGTVFSLVLLQMGVFKASLMAAYASTLFGILFVAILKILHVRPYRRRLILDSES